MNIPTYSNYNDTISRSIPNTEVHEHFQMSTVKEETSKIHGELAHHSNQLPSPAHSTQLPKAVKRTHKELYAKSIAQAKRYKHPRAHFAYSRKTARPRNKKTLV